MTEKQRRRPILYAIAGLAAGAFLVGYIFVVVSTSQTTHAIRESQQSNHQLLDTIATLSHRIDDCTKPTGKCFQRSQKRAAKFGTSLGRHEIATAACQIGISRQSTAATPQELNRQIAACVSETLAQLDRQRAAGR